MRAAQWMMAGKCGKMAPLQKRRRMPKKPESQALEVNLKRTAIDVVIPDDQRVLLDVTESAYGVQQETEKLLREINHAYVGWQQTLEDLHYRAMNDFFYYNSHERGPQGLEIFHGYYEKAASVADPEPLREVAVRYWIYYMERIVSDSKERSSKNAPSLEAAIKRLGEILGSSPARAANASGRLRRLLKALARQEPGDFDGAMDQAATLYTAILAGIYGQWLERDDPVDWYRQLVGDRPAKKAVSSVSHQTLAAHRQELVDVKAQGQPWRASIEGILALPENGAVVRAYLEAAREVEDPEQEKWKNLQQRISWLSRVLGLEALSSVHEQALHEISRAYIDVLQQADSEHLDDFVRETFDILRKAKLPYAQTILDLIRIVGTEVLRVGAPDWVQVVIDEILAFDFQYPRFAGFTKHWQPKVNPSHLKNIRTFFRVIETNPQAAPRMLAALVVHLKLGGLFVADTDIVQKDISQLLAANIEPIYHQIKHLLRLFPVYFNDIGAEGELRDVSTRVDEICRRGEPLTHFLRKQCHVESNPKMPEFVEAICEFWATGDKEKVRQFIPAALYDRLSIDDPNTQGVHAVFRQLAEGRPSIKPLFALSSEELKEELETLSEVSPVDVERTELIFKVRELVGKKYDLDHDDVLQRLRSFHRIDGSQVDALEYALAGGRTREAIEIILEMLERLKALILSDEKTQAIEDIYHKRHVAVGIPSVYGRYREEKFEAMGLSFRIESLGNVLFERMIEGANLEYITKNTLQGVVVWLKMLHRALRIDGCRGTGLSTGIAMLEQALVVHGITVDQYINIFQFIANSIKYLIRARYLEVYETMLERIIPRMIEEGILQPSSDDKLDRQEELLKISEAFLRDLIAQSFGLQRLDGLVGKILHTLAKEKQKLDRTTLNVLMTYDIDRCFVTVRAQDTRQDGIIYLGYKGYMVKKLARANFPVPAGFILTTEVFRCRDAIVGYEEAHHEYLNKMKRHIEQLERRTGRSFGDPSNPLLLSVRSGAAMSMPGMLDTYLNVGINVKIAEGFAKRSGSAWGAWDAYRRFVQLWGMGHGLSRDLFDKLMREGKEKYVVEKKSLLPPEGMREVALAYRQLIVDYDIQISDDPWEQLHTCTDLVLRSWFSDKANVYRAEMQIAQEWGTAVIVQSMIYGNLNQRSGTGVVLSRHPRRVSDEVELYGDFIIQGQGDDVVSGLVETFPISEDQRLTEQTSATMSLERDFPGIFERLTELARSLIKDHGMHHQEIEFTFESEKSEDLYILQARDIVLSQSTSVATFAPTEELERSKKATGIGAGGGALSGRVAHNASDIARLRSEHPEDAIILLRPDTVPDDIQMILRSDGMLTAIGGATSHAAVAAQRLGRPCVVGCRQLEVIDERSWSSLAGHRLESGDFISINGIDGSVYIGKHAVTMTRAEGYTGG